MSSVAWFMKKHCDLGCNLYGSFLCCCTTETNIVVTAVTWKW